MCNTNLKESNNNLKEENLKQDGEAEDRLVWDTSAEDYTPTVLPPEKPSDVPSETGDTEKYCNNASGSLYLLDNKGEEKLISRSYIKSIALTRTSESHKWAKRIEFKNMDGVICHIDIPCSSLLDPKEPLKLLADAGFDIACDRNRLKDYLISFKPDKRIIQIKRNGWISNSLDTGVLVYICPSFTAGNIEGNNTYSLSDSSNNYGYDKQGSLGEWQEKVCRYCENNHILTLSLCAGLSGILLRFIPQVGTTIINIIGKSSIGKTTALNVAASMWGKL